MIHTPLTIHHKLFTNRLVMPPMATAKCGEDDHVTDEIIAYYDEKSKGGYLSLIIIEHSYVMMQGKASARQMSIASDSAIPQLKKLADAIHNNGSLAIMQINHAGTASDSQITGQPVYGPSALVHPRTKQECQAMTAEDIQAVVLAFQQAALRVQAAGFDGVELHGAHGYLLSQFFSPKTNKRTDAYGGSLENRIRLHLEIIQAVKAVVSEDFLVLLRFGACDYMEGGATITDAVSAAKQFEAAGIHAIDITGGLKGFVNPLSDQPGWFQDASKAIKEVVSIPVILTGGIKDIKDAEALLEKGVADLIGVGRSILTDSQWAKHAMEQRNQ